MSPRSASAAAHQQQQLVALERATSTPGGSAGAGALPDLQLSPRLARTPSAPSVLSPRQQPLDGAAAATAGGSGSGSAGMQVHVLPPSPPDAQAQQAQQQPAYLTPMHARGPSGGLGGIPEEKSGSGDGKGLPR